MFLVSILKLKVAQTTIDSWNSEKFPSKKPTIWHTYICSNVGTKVIEYVVVFYAVVWSCNTLFSKSDNMGKAVTLK